MKINSNNVSTCQFRTKRLVVENWLPSIECQIDEAEVLQELSKLLTPKVMQHLPDPLQLSNDMKGLKRWIEMRNKESDVFYVRDINTAELLGLLILADSSEVKNQRTLRIGYLLREECWGKGIATELINGLIGWCVAAQIKGVILGGVAMDNEASAKVLTKCGFTLVEDQSNAEYGLFQSRL